MASLETQLEVNICAIEGYQEDIEAYQKMALSTVVVVGGVGITVQKLLEMSAQQGHSLNDIIKWAGNEGKSGSLKGKNIFGLCQNNKLKILLNYGYSCPELLLLQSS